VVPSGYLQEIFADFQMASVIVPNIIDLERFISVDKKQLNTTAPHFIVCRNLEAIYDVATAVRAFSVIAGNYPRARLTIAGEGPERPLLERQVTTLGIESQVTFAGRLDPEQMAKLYRSADVMLNTSRVDNMPNALLEAMSAGVPIISTDAGGIPHMVEDGRTALLRPVGDGQGIAGAALQLLQQESLYQRLSKAGVKEVTRYRWDAVKPLWMGVYAEALATGSREKIPQA
jgi:glycosyltransferase involved in cell wall biosynthesis